MAVTFEIRFDGLNAVEHHVDMRQLGRSLIGLDKAIGDSLFFVTEGRLPAPRDRRFLVIQVEAPTAACVEIRGIVEALTGYLPFIYDLITGPGTKFIFEFLSFMLKYSGGKRVEADGHLMEAFKIMAEDRQEERAAVYQNEERWRQTALELVDRLSGPLREIVAPIGHSSETLTLAGPAGEKPTLIDVPMAEAMRSKELLEVGEMKKMRVRVDGMIKHSHQLKVEIEETPGRFVTAEVRDPAFDQRPNVYTRAFDNDEFLEVDAKPTYRNGELHKLHIMNAA